MKSDLPNLEMVQLHAHPIERETVYTSAQQASTEGGYPPVLAFPPPTLLGEHFYSVVARFFTRRRSLRASSLSVPLSRASSRFASAMS